MRVIIPNYRAADSFTDNVAETLTDMGHQVLTLPKPAIGSRSSTGRFLLSAAQRAFPSLHTEQERWLLRSAKDFRPDLILAVTQTIKEEVLFEVKRVAPGVRTAVWWGDPPANISGMGLLTKEWDVIFAKDLALARKFKAAGFDAELLHEAMNPKWHTPSGGASSRSVVVAGTYYGYRQFVVSELIARNLPVQIYGPAPPRWAKPEIKNAHSGQYLIRKEKGRVFSNATVNLNSTAMAEGNSLNCRAFEICGSEGFQIMEYRAMIESCFEPNSEILCFNSLDDIEEAYQRANRDRHWWMQIKQAGRKRALAEHTYSHRIATIFAKLGLGHS